MRSSVMVVTLAAAACSNSNRASPDAGATDAAPDARPPTVTVTGMIQEWMSPTMFGAPIAGAAVCRLGSSDCVTTGADGTYSLSGIPVAADFGIAVTANGHVNTTVLLPPIATNTTGVAIGVITDSIGQQKLTLAGGTWPLAGTSIVEVGAYVTSGNSFVPAAGVTNTITPISGHGPVYLGLDGYPDTSLTSTSAEGGVMFVNVPPGMVQIAVTLAGKSCVTTLDGWHGTAPGRVSIPAAADTLVYVQALCM